jgi:hypothetical protein
MLVDAVSQFSCLIYLPAGIPAGVANFFFRKARVFGTSRAWAVPANMRTEEDRRGISGIFRDRESRTESRKRAR